LRGRSSGCVDWPPPVEEVVRGLPRAAQILVLQALHWELAGSDAPNKQNDCRAPDWPPHRWHFVAGYVLEYRPLVPEDASAECEDGGYYISSIREEASNPLLGAIHRSL
jgi:hypothetical protein